MKPNMPGQARIGKVQGVIWEVSKLWRLTPAIPRGDQEHSPYVFEGGSFSRPIGHANYPVVSDGASNSVARTDLRASHFMAGRAAARRAHRAGDLMLMAA